MNAIRFLSISCAAILLAGTVVSTPTDPAAPPTTPSTPQELTKLPAIDWVDDGFVAAQMQLDMSDALDGF
jgi:hypothetical protein